jgi:hypothetical protein
VWRYKSIYKIRAATICLQNREPARAELSEPAWNFNFSSHRSRQKLKEREFLLHKLIPTHERERECDVNMEIVIDRIAREER